MADSQSPESSPALGPRFKAGLQSVLNGLGKSSPVKSNEKPLKKLTQPECALTNGYSHTAEKKERHGNTNNSSDTGDAILGEPENDEDMVLIEGDDALLEGQHH